MDEQRNTPLWLCDDGDDDDSQLSVLKAWKGLQVATSKPNPKHDPNFSS